LLSSNELFKHKILNILGGIIMALFKGSGVAIVTPFNDDNSVNYNEFEKLIEFHIKNETDALFVCATTGESATLSYEEKIKLIQTSIEVVKKRIPIIAGTGSNDTKASIQISKKVNEMGVDGCLIVTPYYNKTTQKGLLSHYSAIAQNIDIPIMLYNVPSRTGMNIEPKTAYELSKIKNITSIKEASGNISQVAKIAAICGDSLDIYSGNDDQILPVMALGGKGAVSVLANIAPKQTHDIVMTYLKGDVQESLKLQLGAINLIEALFKETNPVPVKTALSLIGFKVGGFRLPLTNAEEATVTNLKNEMELYGIKLK
jgi:4-hydroxy-tetrahydrodipicolinate synthase